MTISGISANVSTQQVSAALLKKAGSDGDGKTGVAALNDGDATAQQAAAQVKASKVDVKA